MPPAVVGWDVPIFLRSVSTGQIFNATVRDNQRHREHDQKGQTRLAMPVRFHGELPGAEDFYELHIEGWDRFVYLPAMQVPEAQRKSPELWVALPPLRGINTTVAATLLWHNVRYHTALGLKVTAYVLQPQLQAFHQHEHLQTYLAAKQLELVLWNDMSQCSHFPSCQHTMENSHAVLTAWGEQRLLAMLDIDEYLAFPANLTIDTFMRTCVANNSQVVLSRYDVGCSGCKDEAAVWATSNATVHPLSHYDVVIHALPQNNGKTIVKPNDVLGFAIHSGHTLRGSPELLFLPTECGRVLHIKNMFKQRSDVHGSELTSSILHWPSTLEHA